MFSLVVLMLVGCLSREAWSCTCGPRHPQTVYCESPIVFRAKFVGQKDCAKREQWTEFEVKATKIFKAPKDLDDIQFVYSSRIESMCGYKHTSTNKSEEFLVAGTIIEDMVYITSCSFVVPWAPLSLGQKRGFLQVYAKHCNCQVKQCFGPCSLDNNLQCLWTDPLMRKKSLYANYQSSTYACMYNGEDMCTWKSLKSRVYSATTTVSNTTA
ncbi:metalloproteinase inhibitor 1 [Dendropsophus ebraccatus]|uniref:metalloproteinase inhibitor 1 n=1 Tax=Dendropsophus ebraccatus TaxID=150705 RepID=UPI003831F802